MFLLFSCGGKQIKKSSKKISVDIKKVSKKNSKSSAVNKGIITSGLLPFCLCQTCKMCVCVNRRESMCNIQAKVVNILFVLIYLICDSIEIEFSFILFFLVRKKLPEYLKVEINVKIQKKLSVPLFCVFNRCANQSLKRNFCMNLRRYSIDVRTHTHTQH